VTDSPSMRASDADRDRTVARLREHVAEGRLTLEEFTERMETAYTATTHDELEALISDLPGATPPMALLRSRTRFVFSLFGSTEREGRIRVGRRVTCLTGFGNIDLDLRDATLENEVVTVLAMGVFGAIDVYVPEGIEVDLHGLAILGHKGEGGPDPPPRPGTSLVRVYAFALFAAIDVWRVPLAWLKRSIDDVIDGIQSGRHRELGA
jgi:hypothetical protein